MMCSNQVVNSQAAALEIPYLISKVRRRAVLTLKASLCANKNRHSQLKPKPHYFDLLWISCPQRIEVMEFGLKRVK